MGARKLDPAEVGGVAGGRRGHERIFWNWIAVAALVGSQATAAGSTPLYTFGVVPQFDARRTVSVWRPVLDGVEARTGFEFQLVGTSAIPDFERQFLSGRFDCAYMNPYHVVVAKRNQGYVPLVRDGGRVLRGVVVAEKGGEIQSLEDLAGRSVAFPARNALGASLLVRAELKRRGIGIEPGYVQTHTSVYLAVAMGRAVAGGGVRSTLQEQPAVLRDRLQVVYTTDPVKPHPVVCHPRVPSAHRAAIREALIADGHSSGLHGHYSEIPMTDPVPAEYEDYKPLEDMGLKRLYRAE